MNLPSLIFGAGAVGPFASRVFLPALLTSLLMRFGPSIPWVSNLYLLHAAVGHGPTWFTSDWCIITLGVLAALEIFGQKTPEIRHVFHEIDVYLKPALALLTTLGVMSVTDASFVKNTARQASLFDGLLPLGVAVATWQVARYRQPVARALFEHLEGTPLDHLFSWAEDAWATFGPIILVLFPFVMLAITAAVVGLLVLVRRRLARAEEHARVPCPQCGSMIYPCAVACHTCGRRVVQPAAVGLLGLSKPYPAADPAAQPFRLAERRRCPICAAHLPPARPKQPCPTCGDVTRTTPAFANGYAADVARRVPTVLAICFAMSLVPIVGLIAGVVYFRMVLVLPFAEYLPMGRRFMLRWGVRILFLVLALFQLLPLLGGFVVPVMALISYAAYRRAYLSVMSHPAEAGPAVAKALAV